MKLGILVVSLVVLGSACAVAPKEEEGTQVSAVSAPRGELCHGAQCATAGTTPLARCLDDSDCRALSSYCDGCNCLALGELDSEPLCQAPMVACILDPCHHKHPACVEGVCQLLNN